MERVPLVNARDDDIAAGGRGIDAALCAEHFAGQDPVGKPSTLPAGPSVRESLRDRTRSTLAASLALAPNCIADFLFVQVPDLCWPLLANGSGSCAHRRGLRLAY